MGAGPGWGFHHVSGPAKRPPPRARVMQGRAGPLESARPFALWPLRLGVGGIFILAGWSKFTNFAAWEATVADLGFPFVTTFALLVAVAEFFGGIGLVLGILTRFSASTHAIIMVTALLLVRIFGDSPGGWRLDLALLVGSLALVVNGPGRPTVFSVFERPVLDPEVWIWRKLRSLGGPLQAS